MRAQLLPLVTCCACGVVPAACAMASWHRTIAIAPAAGPTGIAALGGPNVLLATILASITFLWYLLTDRAADWVPNTMPYALVLVVLVFASQSLKAPAADGQPYRRGEA